MRQGNDVGTQYRSAIYWDTDEQRAAGRGLPRRVPGAARGRRDLRTITTEIAPAGPFYYAEDYHQQYLHKNPRGYCGLGGTGVSCPVGVGASSGVGSCPAPLKGTAGETGRREVAALASSARTRQTAPNVASSSLQRSARDGSSEGPALVVDGLTKRFGDRVAFQDVSFEVGYGEVFGFLGPNGAGKTTTVRTLGTLIAPTSGSATITDLALTPENGVEIRRRIAIMPEAPGLYLRLSVAENLACFAGLYELAAARERIEHVLRAVKLTDRAADLCGTLSKGLRQRVALARALLSDPEVLFLDEPTSGLDPVAARDVHQLIDDLRHRGVTIFLTTHRLDEAERLCDRVAILNQTLRTIGRPEELRERLFAKTLTVRTRAPLADPDDVFGGLPAVEGWHQDAAGDYVVAVADATLAAPAVTRSLVGAGADVLSVGESRHSLQEVYLEFIDEDVELNARRA